MESSLILNVHVQRDDKKMYIIVQDPSRLIMTQAKEMALTVKQATQLLMYCHNDFHVFIGEVLTIKHDQVTLRDVNKVKDKLMERFLQPLQKQEMPI